MRKTNVLITGATGFIGNHLVQELNKPELRRKYNVVCFVRKPIIYNFILGSLEDKDSLHKATKNIDRVVHLASETRSSDKELNYKINTIGTKNLIEACKKNKVKMLIFSGTVNADFKKKGVYGETKRQAENIVKNSGLGYIILKFNMVYGQGDNNLTKTIKLVKKLPIIPIIGDGKKRLQPVYVKDVVYAIIKCLEHKQLNNKIYNIAGPKAITFNKYIDIISNTLNIKKIKMHIPVFFVRLLLFFTGKAFDYIITIEILNSINQDKSMDISDSQKDLGFNPKDLKTVLPYLVEKGI